MLKRLRANLKLFSIVASAGCIVIIAVNAIFTPRFPMPKVSYHPSSAQESSAVSAFAPAQDIPQGEEREAQPEDAQEAFADTQESIVTQSFPVNINAANAQELDTVAGIGPVIAQRIIEYREQTGGFSSVEELLEVKGIGAKTLEKMLPFICLE